MLFKFLKYLQPTHYFIVPKIKGDYIYPKLSKLPETILKDLDIDNGFSTKLGSEYDASWQAIQKGYVGNAKTIVDIKPLHINDEYRFIRKYFHPAWVFYVLIFQLISFKNPIKNIGAWIKTRNVKRVTYLKRPIEYPSFEKFTSLLIEANPKVSVIIPTLNRYAYLKDVLRDLESQDYKNFEVIVVDQSEAYNESFYSNFNLDLKVSHQKEKALWLARNNAIKKSDSEYLLFFDDDSRVESNWITSHLKCLDFFKADVSSGVSISKVGAEVPAHYSFFKISDQLDTGNVMIRKDVFKKVGLFDRQFEKQRMGDGEFGMRVYLNDFLNVSNPYAKRLHLKVGTGGLREMGSWDAFRTRKLLSPRPIPSVLYFFRSYFGNKLSKYALMRLVPLSIMPYKFKKNKAMLIFGVFVSIFLIPLVFYQVVKSWSLASKKIKIGSLIETL